MKIQFCLLIIMSSSFFYSYPWIARYADRSITELEVRHAVLNAVVPDVEDHAQLRDNVAPTLATGSHAAYLAHR